MSIINPKIVKTWQLDRYPIIPKIDNNRHTTSKILKIVKLVKIKFIKTGAWFFGMFFWCLVSMCFATFVYLKNRFSWKITSRQNLILPYHLNPKLWGQYTTYGSCVSDSIVHMSTHTASKEESSPFLKSISVSVFQPLSTHLLIEPIFCLVHGWLFKWLFSHFWASLVQH